MSFYTIILFLHITGALALFIGIGIEWMTVSRLQKVSTRTLAVEWVSSFKILRKVFSFSAILILLSGIYMSVKVWGMSAWIDFGFILFILLAVFGSAIVGKKAVLVSKALESEGETLSEKMRDQLGDPILTRSLPIRASLALCIIFLMTIKPDWPSTILTVGVALLIGFLLTKVIK